jgi:hypothetical protein
MRTALGLLALGAVLATPAIARAQGGALRAGAAVKGAPAVGSGPADSRKGFWMGAGVGTGAGSMHCAICDHEREQGTAGYLRAGTTLNRKLLIGVEGSGWQRSSEVGKRRLVSLTGGAWWYPNERHGYYLHWGAGLSRWRAWQKGDAVTSQAMALMLGAGYEVRVNPKVSIVPYLNALGSSSGALWLENSDNVSFERRKLPTGGHALLFQIGLGITRH